MVQVWLNVVNRGLKQRALAMGIKRAEHDPSRAARLRMTPARGYFHDRRQHEYPRRHSRMWQHGLAGLSADLAVVIEKIEIEGSRSPAQPAPPPGHALDQMEPLHQGLRRQRCFDLRNGIDEIGLTGAAEWRGLHET